MSEENKDMNLNEEQPKRKPFSVNISDEDFAASDIPAPEAENAEAKPHKVVRYVDNAPKTEKPAKAKEEKKKAGFMGEFLAGAAAGAKSVSEGISAGAKSVGESISAGAKTVSEKAPKAEKPAKTEAPKAEKPVKAQKVKEVEDETQFPKDAKKKSSAPQFTEKLKNLPTKTVIIGAAAALVVLVAVIILAATSCSAGSDTPSDDTPSGSENSGVVIGPGNTDEGEDEPEEGQPVEVPTRKEKYVEAFNANNDVMGWLYIPGLSDVDAGVCFSPDKKWPYDRRDITGKKVSRYWETGAYYTHYRNLCGATADELSTNTIIFGHSDLGSTNLSNANDDPTGPLFSQLFSFKDPKFAEKTPYIYVTLPEEDTFWEVFAVFYNDSKATGSIFQNYYESRSFAGDLWYIEPSPVEAEYELMLQTIKDRSIYDYNVEVDKDDKILTLSTCTVGFGYSGRGNYRFVVVAKLVENPETEHIEKNAVFTINADAPVPKSYQSEFDGYAKSWKPSEE